MLLLFLCTAGCSSPDSSSGGSANASVPAVPYCSTISTHSSPITITGNATYQYRTNGNGAVAAAKPIRHAEVRVTNSSGTIIQCGETDSSGAFSLSLPSDGSTALVSVTSRSDNNFVKAYILNNPTQNLFHSISKSVTLNSSQNIGTLNASATDSLEGGAFNILDKILDTNSYLRTQTANCQGSFANCTPFTVAPLVYTYWAKGVNPGQYFGLAALSFFLPDRNHLYILGGVNGDVDNSDTDHFDDTIIVHEYGHYLENVYSKTDSPGGPHNADNILDPRLAWSEAWANFLQAVVTGNPVYRDTFGTPLGTNGVYINENLETRNGSSADVPTEAAEGNFREFSITRVLVDLEDNTPGETTPFTDNVNISFAEFWTLFSATTGGFADTSQNFRSVGLLYTLQSALAGGSTWTAVLNAEQQLAARTNYANTLSNGTSCPTTILAESVPGASPLKGPGRQPEDGSFVNSNQFKSNDFYQITHGGGSLTINMSYTTTGGNAADLDIYLYQNAYTYGSTTAGNILGLSEDTISNAASSGSEAITISSLPSGTYMLNVRYDTTLGIKSAANYSLTINSQSVCPD